ncbi:MAG: ferrous iron transport protein B [Gemmataceae bacterium]|nr:ferrous iron transport protein B [Gemmataceae bacterium]
MVLLRTPTIALVGNPNTGKTTLFNLLAGMRQRVGNYPGVTVETKKGKLHHNERSFDLVDLPGTYSLAPRSPDEMVAVDLILGHQQGEARPDVVLAIVDASNLERNLYLTTQVLEVGVPVVIALNMVDVAEGQGIKVDAEKLSKQLEVPVVPIQANKGKGSAALKNALAAAIDNPTTPKGPTFPAVFEAEVQSLGAALGKDVEPFLIRRLLLDVGGYAEQRLTDQHTDLQGKIQASRQRLAAGNCAVPAIEARTRYAWIRQATAGCVQRPQVRAATWTDSLDRVLTHKLWGTLLFLALMFIVFQAIFTWALPLMDTIDQGREWLAELVKDAMGPGPVRDLLVNGIIKGVGSVVIFLPQILILFGFIAVLEDCGYMARAAFLMDKLMARCGLSGKSFIPMLSSVACAVPGIMATRVIENRRDRLATILVAPLMSCSARLPIYILLIGAFLTEGHAWYVPGLVMFCMYLIGLVVAPLVALVLKRTLLRGETPIFVMEMPLYKLPSARTVVRRVVDSAWAFVYRAGTIILASMIVVWALLYFPNTNGAGERYDELIEKTEKSVEKQKEELEPVVDSLNKKKKEVQEINKELKSGGVGSLFGLLGPSDGEKQELEKKRELLRTDIKRVEEENESVQKPVKDAEDRVNELNFEWRSRSILGQIGHWIEPAVKPLGWDWRIGMAAVASFPAREVVVGTLGIIYNLGEVSSKDIRDSDDPGRTELAGQLKEAKWDNDPNRAVFGVPVALSVMVFFALCCQCASTLAVIKRETNSWRWPIFTFVYMTVLAYVGALVVYQVGSMF